MWVSLFCACGLCRARASSPFGRARAKGRVEGGHEFLDTAVIRGTLCVGLCLDHIRRMEFFAARYGPLVLLELVDGMDGSTFDSVTSRRGVPCVFVRKCNGTAHVLLHHRPCTFRLGGLFLCT